MTQDDLYAALLLMGFKHGTKERKTLVYVAVGVCVIVTFNANPNNTGVRFCLSGSKWQQANTTPEAVFNFIKKRLL